MADAIKEQSIQDHPLLNRPHADWFFRELARQPRFAHHPTCDCYDNHLIRLGKFAFCLGCTSLVFGALLASITLALLASVYFMPTFLTSLPHVWCLGVVLYLPTLVQPFLQSKSLKIFSRTLLGIAIVLLCYGALFLPEWSLVGLGLRVVFLIIFWRIYQKTQAFRDKHTPKPQDDCERGCFPFCEGNQDRLDCILEQLEQQVPEDDPFMDFATQLVATRDGDVHLNP